MEQFVPQEHYLRKVNKHVDFSFIRKLTAKFYCKNIGRPSLDPEVFFRITLLGYLCGINEDRRLCRELQANLAYRWFCRLNIDDEIPSHSSLSRIRDKYGVAIFKQFFEQILKQGKVSGVDT